MAFLNLNDLSCPQYLDFNQFKECDMSKDSLSEADSSSYSAKDMDMDVSETGVQYYSESRSMCTTMASPYSANSSYQESVGETESSYGKENFPVNRPQNLLSDPNGKGKSRARKNNGTVVKPFNLHEGRKRKRDNSEDLIPLAEQVIAFHKKTPERFHTTGKKKFEPTKHWSPQLVRPKSPNLQAAKRRRSIHFLSREEQEAKEAEEIKKYKFRARPVNENVLRSGPRLPKVGRKLPTRPKEFPLKTAQRAAENNAKKIEEDEHFEFHARPVPKAILEGPTGLKEKPVIPATIPKTPNFALKTRAAKWKSESKLNVSAPESQKFKAAPAPAPTSNFTVKLEKKRTEIQPFSFDIKDKERIAKKEQKIAEVIEEETKPFIFKAQLMPSPTHKSSLPPVPRKPPTRPQPFSLYTETRTSKHNSLNLSQETECPVFKAQPATVLQKPPFIPEKPPKQPVEVQEFELHTNIRASERLKLKAINDEKEREKELALQRLREIEEEKERIAIKQLRKEIVHKANPIRQYKPVEIKPSDKHLTEPKAPKFLTDQRLQSKSKCD